jgi:hypothetical protein
VFQELNKTNALAKYVILHTVAVRMAAEAGRSLATDSAGTRVHLHYAMLYNAFADHFLQDAFSSGHLCVNRSVLGSIINNKALHDFYSKHGLDVVNLQGDVWRSYGDGYFNHEEAAWRQQDRYADIEVRDYSPNAERAIAATAQSLFEVWEAFEQARRNQFSDPLEGLPEDKKDWALYYIGIYPCLSIIPVPYGSDLDRYAIATDSLDELKAINLRIHNRNFVRSRVANSLLIGFGGSLDGRGVSYFEFRFNFGRSGLYHDTPHKKGTLDFWLGPTAAFAVASSKFFDDVKSYQFRLGPSATMDTWVSDKRYFGTYAYVDAGLISSSGTNKLFLSPSIGLQPGPLIGLDNFALPQWIWLPLRILIPIKIRLQANYVPGLLPEYQLIGDVDVLF